MKRKVARAPEIEASQLARAIARKAKFLGDVVVNDALPAKHRVAAEKRLREAWQALRPSQWSTATTQRAVLQALDTPSKFLERGVWSEERALKQAMTQLRGVQNDDWAPVELAARHAPESLVLACLRASHASRGRPRSGVTSATAAQAKLFAVLGIGGGDPRALRKLRERSKSRPQKT